MDSLRLLFMLTGFYIMPSSTIQIILGYAPDSVCGGYTELPPSYRAVLTTDGLSVSPPCIIGLTSSSHNCFFLSNSHVSCVHDSYILVLGYKLKLYGETYAPRTDQPFFEYTIVCNDLLLETKTFCLHDPPWGIAVEMFINITDKSNETDTRLNIQVESKANHQKESIYTDKERHPSINDKDHQEQPLASKCDYKCVFENALKINAQRPEKSDGVDVNKLIAIIGGVTTSLIVPVVLLLVRHFIKKKENDNPNKERDKGDGNSEDEDVPVAIEDGDEEDGDDKKSQSLSPLHLLVPRNSMSSLDTFHSVSSDI